MVLCDLLIRLAQHGMYRARWSHEILEETTRSIMRRRPELTMAQLRRRVDLMNAAIPGAEVSGHSPLARDLENTMGGDAHVLAAAIVGRVDVIVTRNLKDFPAATLDPYGINAQDPDAFLVAQLGLREGVVRETLVEQAAALNRPRMSPRDVLTRLQPMTPMFVAEARSLFVERHEVEQPVDTVS